MTKNTSPNLLAAPWRAYRRHLARQLFAQAVRRINNGHSVLENTNLRNKAIASGLGGIGLIAIAVLLSDKAGIGLIDTNTFATLLGVGGFGLVGAQPYIHAHNSITQRIFDRLRLPGYEEFDGGPLDERKPLMFAAQAAARVQHALTLVELEAGIKYPQGHLDCTVASEAMLQWFKGTVDCLTQNPASRWNRALSAHGDAITQTTPGDILQSLEGTFLQAEARKGAALPRLQRAAILAPGKCA